MPKRKQEKLNEKIIESKKPETIFKINLQNIFPSSFEEQIRRRRRFKQESLQELADSLKAEAEAEATDAVENEIIPPIIVRLKEIGEYELIDGERRWLAAKLAKLNEISAIVRNVSDEKALEMQMKLNLNRLEPNPLDEAYSFKYFIEHHNLTPAEIAARFGRTEHLVWRRLKLNQLIPAAVNDLEAGDLPLGHAEEIALFPPETQTDVLKTCIYKYNDKSYGCEPLDKCKKRIVDNIVLNLPNAVFDLTATNLHPDGLACVNCEQRTGFTPMLFDAEITKDDHCLNKKCFEAKKQTHFGILKEAYLTETRLEKPVFVSESWVGTQHQEKFGDGEFKAYQEYSETKECESSRPALSIDAANFGQTVYFCNDENCPVHENDGDDNDQPSAQSLKNEEKKLRIRVNNQVREKIIREIGAGVTAEHPFSDNQDWIKRLVFRMLGTYEFRGDAVEFIKGWKGFPKDIYKDEDRRRFIESLDSDQLQQIMFYAAFGKLGFSSWDLVDQTEVRNLAHEHSNLDYDLLFAEALLEFAPAAGKDKAQNYLDKIRAKESAEIPRFFWTQEAEAEFGAAAEDDDNDDDENYEYDDETEDEDDE